MQQKSNHPTSGKLGLLTVGMGAVATTTYAGVLAASRGLGQAIGSLSQMGHLTPEDPSSPFLKDALALTPLKDIVFGGWDVFSDNAYSAALKAGVLSRYELEPFHQSLSQIVPMPAVFEQFWVKKLEGANNVKHYANKWQAAELLIKDIEDFKKSNNLERLVIVWCASTEIYKPLSNVHTSVKIFEKGLRDNHPDISPSQIYAYAALRTGVPFANGAPNVALEAPAFRELAQEFRVPMCGKDFKTGQTFIKTAIAPALKSRLLGIRGWFSTNILGNRDGLVLNDPESFKSKELTKVGVLESILQPQHYPDLYGTMTHQVHINYYPPRGDDKEGWDNIDIFGWLGQPMQIKVNFLCKDSILAAPIVLDLALFLDLAKRCGLQGMQEWLGFYFKAPLLPENQGHAENDLFRQHRALYKTLQELV